MKRICYDGICNYIIIKRSVTKHLNAQITNRGIGAGGANTNKNGLPYEQWTDLRSEYTVVSTDNYCEHIQFNNSNTIYLSTKQSKLFKCMDKYIDKNVNRGHGCKNPDECFIDLSNHRMFIIEKKFQQVSGSVCEKIQTIDFKLWQYRRTFPNFEIVYMYCLSEWFKLNCKAELEYLQEQNIPVYWGNDTDYKAQIVGFITNYE